MTASTGNPTPPAAAMVTDGSMITVSEEPVINSEFPDGYAPFASPVSTLTSLVSESEMGILEPAMPLTIGRVTCHDALDRGTVIRGPV